MRGVLSADQVERLLRPIKPNRVFQSQGQSNVAAWDIKAHLDRMFGFGGWEKQILELTCVSADRGPALGLDDKKGWYVTYRCQLRLRIFSDYGSLIKETDDGATGTAQNYPQLGKAHDFAMKNAISYALKRCSVELGDQFGLSLYRNGSTGAVVGMTLVTGNSTTSKADAPGEEPEHIVEGEDYDPDDMERPFE